MEPFSKDMKQICWIIFLVIPSSAFAQRLPQTTIPNHYSLYLDPLIAQKAFRGEETIDVYVSTATKEIVLNSLDLGISEAEVKSGGKTQKAAVTYDKPQEMAQLSLPEPVPAGEAQIHLKFSGKLTEGLRGLYLSKGARRQYAVTQFEGTYARMMLPCFDEPAFKATFDLTVMADNGDTAISNGRIAKDEPAGGNRHKITFSTSPKMSTYLVALAIGDWQCLSRTVDNVPIRVCAEPDKKQYGAFALDVASHSIEFYNQWYGIKYPFGKLDMVAIPDYEWGGMENTASIFYRDTALLLGGNNASVFRKRAQAVTIAHEIAHQWFGDLVTAAWWDDIWLNEGFATWMSRKPIAVWHPEWHLEDDAAEDAQQIIGVDSLATARAIHGNPSTPSEIKEMFDGITYEKGGAVLRMLESYVGAQTFRKGVNAYLAAHANGNATSTDFWRAEAQASGKPIDKIMPTFVLQPGVPLLSLSTSCNKGSDNLELKQQRFLVSPERLQSASNEIWQIPTCTKTDKNVAGDCSLITQREQTVSSQSCSDWVFGNRDAKGYYRVAYAPEDLKKVADAAEQQLNVPERIALVEDTWALTHAGKASVADFLDLTQHLRGDENRHIVGLLARHLEYIGDSLVSSSHKEPYRVTVRAQFAPLAKTLGWSARANDTDEQKALRANLLATLGSAGDPDAVAASRKIVEQYMQNPTSADGTISGSAFTVAAENGDQAFYDQLTNALANAKTGDEYNHYLYALAAFRESDLVQHTIGLVDQGRVRQQDYPRFFGALLSNSASRDSAWKYLKDHWEDMAQKVTSFGGAGAVSALGNSCSAEMRDDVKQFFTNHPAPGAQRTVQQSLERIDGCIDFRRRQGSNFQNWVKGQR